MDYSSHHYLEILSSYTQSDLLTERQRHILRLRLKDRTYKYISLVVKCSEREVYYEMNTLKTLLKTQFEDYDQAKLREEGYVRMTIVDGDGHRRKHSLRVSSRRY